MESIGTCELKDRNCRKTEIPLCLCSAGAATPSPLASLRASCLLHSCSILSLLWEDSGFLHQTAWKEQELLPCQKQGILCLCLPSLSSWRCEQLVAVPQSSVGWKLLVCHDTESSSSLSIALRREHFGLCCVSIRFDRFSLSPLNHWWKSARLKGHVLLFVAGKQNKTR